MSDQPTRGIPGEDIPPRPGQRMGTRFRRMVRTRTMQEMFARESRPGELVFAAGFFAVSLLLLALLPSQTTWVPRTKIYVQPAFWPGIAILVMVIFSGLHLLGALVSEHRPGVKAELISWLRPVEFLLWFLVYVWLVPVIGYLIATVAFSCGLSFRMGYRSGAWMGIAALFGVLVVVLFKTVLGVNIPAGEVYDLLPAGGFRSFLMTNF